MGMEIRPPPRKTFTRGDCFHWEEHGRWVVTRGIASHRWSIFYVVFLAGPTGDLLLRPSPFSKRLQRKALEGVSVIFLVPWKLMVSKMLMSLKNESIIGLRSSEIRSQFQGVTLSSFQAILNTKRKRSERRKEFLLSRPLWIT